MSDISMTPQQAAPAIAAGFRDAVHDAQSVFNDVMQAMARPGTIRTIRPAIAAPAPVSACAAAVLLALADYDTTVWLDGPSAAAPEALRWLRFHSGTKITSDTEQAAFALITNPSAMPDLSYFAPGTPLYPDRSTTLIVQVDDLHTEAGWTLQGPGIEDKAQLAVSTLPDVFARQWMANHARFPLGVDIIFCTADRLACLPRTTRIVPSGAAEKGER